MVIKIGSNIASLKAQRSLANATDSLSATYERLSSGMRINRASDDAAGLAVADSLNTQKRLYSTSMRNISDGLSALSIASGSLNSQSTIITRMIELAEQSANGTFSSTQRDTLQNEYLQLTREFGRIAATSTFNGRTLLYGTNRGGLGTLNLQVGVDGGRNSNIGVSIGDSGQLSGVLDRNVLHLETGDISGFTNASESDLRTNFGMGLFKVSDDIFVGVNEAGSFGLLEYFVYRKNVGANTFSEVQNATLKYDNQTGEIDSVTAANALSVGVDFRALVISDSTGRYAPNNGVGTNIEFSNVTSQTYAKQSLDILRNRLQSLSQLKGSIGSSESRLKTALLVNATQQIESASAESRIRDIDIASESSMLVATQIRQRVAAQVLKEANIQPQIALMLLRSR